MSRWENTAIWFVYLPIQGANLLTWPRGVVGTVLVVTGSRGKTPYAVGTRSSPDLLEKTGALGRIYNSDPTHRRLARVP